jgi:cytochrome c7-like protein
MNCHSQIWAQSPYLEPVRASFRDDTSIEWTRVHDLPDFVYFDHSIHVDKGVGCETCHGRVDEMPLMYQASSLQMRWCLDCHRNPEKYLRPKDQVFTMGWQPPIAQAELGERLKREYHIRDRAVLESCSTCHR